VAGELPPPQATAVANAAVQQNLVAFIIGSLHREPLFRTAGISKPDACEPQTPVAAAHCGLE
jgi:hypothetical protein